jgi:methyltransferase
VVAAEIAVLPLVFHMAAYALLFSALNASILWVRIDAEARALHEPPEEGPRPGVRAPNGVDRQARSKRTSERP